MGDAFVLGLSSVLSTTFLQAGLLQEDEQWYPAAEAEHCVGAGWGCAQGELDFWFGTIAWPREKRYFA